MQTHRRKQSVVVRRLLQSSLLLLRLVLRVPTCSWKTSSELRHVRHVQRQVASLAQELPVLRKEDVVLQVVDATSDYIAGGIRRGIALTLRASNILPTVSLVPETVLLPTGLAVQQKISL